MDKKQTPAKKNKALAQERADFCAVSKAIIAGSDEDAESAGVKNEVFDHVCKAWRGPVEVVAGVINRALVAYHPKQGVKP